MTRIEYSTVLRARMTLSLFFYLYLYIFLSLFLTRIRRKIHLSISCYVRCILLNPSRILFRIRDHTENFDTKIPLTYPLISWIRELSDRKLEQQELHKIYVNFKNIFFKKKILSGKNIYINFM